MKKKIIRILSILIIFVYIMSFCNILFAYQGDVLTSMFTGNDSSGIADGGVTIAEKIITPILSAIRIIATGVAVIMLTYLGIKYMSSAPAEKASFKNQLVTYTVGAICVIGATKILDIIMDLVTQLK